MWQIGPGDFAVASAQLCDVLRRLAHGANGSKGSGSSGSSMAGGGVRESCLRLLFEALEVSNSLAKQPWAQPRALEALGLAKEAGRSCWTAKERAEIDKWLSTARARGMRC